MKAAQKINKEAAIGAVKQRVSKKWWILLIQGIATILLGILLIAYTPKTLIALAWALGIYWLVGGVLDVIGSFTGKEGNRHWFWQFLGGLFGIAIGLILILNPQSGGAIVPLTMTVIVGIGAIAGGVFSLIGGIMMHKQMEGELSMIIWGIIMVIIGILIIANLAVSTHIYVYVAAAAMIIGGIAALVGAFRLRSLGSL